MPQRTVPVWMPTRMLTDSLRSSSKSWMAEIMARPISTQFRAWSFFGSGQPKIGCYSKFCICLNQHFLYISSAYMYFTSTSYILIYNSVLLKAKVPFLIWIFILLFLFASLLMSISFL